METSDGQIARLTELARRVWPDRDAKVSTSDDPEEWGACVILDESGEWEQHLATSHPRALDALEAALLVLLDHHSIDAEMMRAALRLTEIAKNEAQRTPAWAEKLAADMEREAVAAGCLYPDQLVRWAAELRERAKGGGR